MKAPVVLRIAALVLLAGCAAAKRDRDPVVPPTECNIQYGAFGKTVAFIEAEAQGFFAAAGLKVCYNQVTGSPAQFAHLYNGSYDLISTTTDNAINRFVNQIDRFPDANTTAPPVQIVAAAGQGPQLSLWANASVPSLSAVTKQTKIGVDAPNSGLVFALRKLLKSVNITGSPGDDFTFVGAGGTAARVTALKDKTVAATMLFAPFTYLAAQDPNLAQIGLVEDVIPSLQLDGITALRSYGTTPAGRDKLVRFLAALIEGGRFARKRRNRAAAVADIAAVYPVQPETFLDAALDDETGENRELKMNFDGLRAAIDLRAEFNGFPGKTVNSASLVKPAADGLYYGAYLEAALKLAGRGNNSGKGKGKTRGDDDDDDDDDRRGRRSGNRHLLL